MLDFPVALLMTALAPAVHDFPITWAGEKYTLEELPETLAEDARETAATWAPWATDVGYRMDFSKGGRVLLLTFDDHKGRKKSEKNMKVIEDVLALMDEILPLPASRPVEASTPKAEDGTYEWGKIELESRTAVLIEADEIEHHVSAVEFVVEQSEYLDGWGSSAKGMTGFVLEQPLAAAWQPKAGIKEDWEGDPTNEMVNRLGQVMTLRRFGRQPYWLSMGIAWYAEMEERGAVFCFPYRQGFVSASEHNKWDKALRNVLKRREEPITMRELTVLQRGTFKSQASKMAWATVAFLVKHHPGALSEICEDLHRLWDEEGRTTQEDGTWTRIPDFEPSESAQMAVFEKHVPGFGAEVLRFFIEGKNYEKP